MCQLYIKGPYLGRPVYQLKPLVNLCYNLSFFFFK